MQGESALQPLYALHTLLVHAMYDAPQQVPCTLPRSTSREHPPEVRRCMHSNDTTSVRAAHEYLLEYLTLP